VSRCNHCSAWLDPDLASFRSFNHSQMVCCELTMKENERIRALDRILDAAWNLRGGFNTTSERTVAGQALLKAGMKLSNASGSRLA
jgi:hypothetical protein